MLAPPHLRGLKVSEHSFRQKVACNVWKNYLSQMWNALTMNPFGTPEFCTCIIVPLQAGLLLLLFFFCFVSILFFNLRKGEGKRMRDSPTLGVCLHNAMASNPGPHTYYSVCVCCLSYLLAFKVWFASAKGSSDFLQKRFFSVWIASGYLEFQRQGSIVSGILESSFYVQIGETSDLATVCYRLSRFHLKPG